MPAPPLGITERAEVIRWIDADTPVVRLGWPLHVRLDGIQAPEQHGDPVRFQAGLEFVNTICPVGREVIIWIPTDHAKSLGHIWSFERIPATIWLRQDDDDTLQDIIVHAGHARRAS